MFTIFQNFFRAAFTLAQAASNAPHFHEGYPNSFGDKNSSGSRVRAKPGQPYRNKYSSMLVECRLYGPLQGFLVTRVSGVELP